jgi:DNA-binding CsgD family transcriptional regulator
MKRFDITRKTVYYHLKKYRRGHTRRYDRKEVLDAIATRNMLGYSDRATARRLGISHDTVGRYRASMGLPPVPKGSQRKKEQW